MSDQQNPLLDGLREIAMELKEQRDEFIEQASQQKNDTQATSKAVAEQLESFIEAVDAIDQVNTKELVTAINQCKSATVKEVKSLSISNTVYYTIGGIAFAAGFVGAFLGGVL